LRGGSNRPGADQLVALLGPDTAAAGVDPGRPGVRVVVRPAHEGSVAVAGQRDGRPLVGVSNGAGADQLAVQPSLIDLKTLGATLDVIRLAGNKPTRAILARVRAAGTRHEESVAWLAGQGIEVCPAMLGERVIYQDAYAQGLSVGEAEPAGKAAEEIKQVYLYVSSLLGLSMIRRTHDEEIRSAGKRIAQ
jgi:hypothetical protein